MAGTPLRMSHASTQTSNFVFLFKAHVYFCILYLTFFIRIYIYIYYI